MCNIIFIIKNIGKEMLFLLIIFCDI